LRPDVEYELKNQYLENNIEGEMVYFKHGATQVDNSYLLRKLRQEMDRKDELEIKIYRQMEEELFKRKKMKGRKKDSKNIKNHFNMDEFKTRLE